MTRSPLRLLCSCGLALSLCAVALAQPAKDQPQRDPLRGPQVRDRNVPGVSGSFGEPGEKRRSMAERIPERVFQQAMQTIMSDDAPGAIRVSDDQRSRYESWMQEHAKSIREYQRSHSKEIAELRQLAGERAGGGGGGKRPGQGGPDAKRPQPDDSMQDGMKPNADAKEAISARERLQTLMAGAPKVENLYTRIWTDLRPEQQRAVDAKIDAFRAQQAQQREESYVKQRMKKDGAPDQPAARPADQKPGPDGQTPRRRPNAANPDNAPQGEPQRPANRPNAQIDPQRRDRLMRILSRMTPEQQDQLLDRLEERLKNEGGQPGAAGDKAAPPKNPARRPGAGNRGPQGPGEPRPAPQPDDSMFPTRGEPSPD